MVTSDLKVKEWKKKKDFAMVWWALHQKDSAMFREK